MKLGVAGLSHETITFQPGITPLEDFERFALHGTELIEKRRNTETYIGGFIDICEPEGVDLYPVCDTFGGVSGIVSDEVYDFYVDEMKREFGKVAEELDGILLGLQGNIVTESLEETESYVIREIREVVGYDKPIMCAMDLHANVAPALLDWATVVCSDHCSPHIDKREVGRRTARTMLSTLRGEIKPTVAMAKAGVLVQTYFPFGNTFISPGKHLVSRRKKWENHPGVIDVSIFYGFAYADVPQVGMTMVAVTDNDPRLAQEVVEDLAKLAWAKRKELTGGGYEIYSVKEGVALAMGKVKGASKPIMIFDPANHSYDTTFLLQELHSQGARNTALPLILDPEGARACVEIGEGSTLELEVGGKTGWRDGGPVKVRGKVLWAGDIKYIGRGARAYHLGTGMTRSDQHMYIGPIAIIDVDGLWIQLTSYKCALTDDAPFTLFGNKPRDFDIIATRTRSQEFYSDIVEETIIVDSPAQCPADLSLFEWKNVPPGIYLITSNVPRTVATIWKNE